MTERQDYPTHAFTGEMPRGPRMATVPEPAVWQLLLFAFLGFMVVRFVFMLFRD